MNVIYPHERQFFEQTRCMMWKYLRNNTRPEERRVPVALFSVFSKVLGDLEHLDALWLHLVLLVGGAEDERG